MTLTHYIGGKLTGTTADFDLPLSTNYPNLTTFINFETFREFILVDNVWELIGVTGFDLTDLKSYFKFNSVSGDIINNAGTVGSTETLGSDADLIPNGGITSVAGKIGNARQSDGIAGSYMKSGVDSGTGLTQYGFTVGNNALFTIAGWFKSTLADQGGALFTSWNNGSTGDTGIAMLISNSATPDFFNVQVRANAGSGFFVDEDFLAILPDDSQWHFIVWRYNNNGGANNVEVSVDGGAFQTGTGTTANVTDTSTRALTFACYAGSLNVCATGAFDEYSIWNRLLTDQEVADLYNNGGGLEL